MRTEPGWWSQAPAGKPPLACNATVRNRDGQILTVRGPGLGAAGGSARWRGRKLQGQFRGQAAHERHRLPACLGGGGPAPLLQPGHQPVGAKAHRAACVQAPQAGGGAWELEAHPDVVLNTLFNCLLRSSSLLLMASVVGPLFGSLLAKEESLRLLCLAAGHACTGVSLHCMVSIWNYLIVGAGILFLMGSNMRGYRPGMYLG